MEKKAVIVRTYSAGVHFGYVESQSEDGKKVTLTRARMIWSWKEANTLREMSLRGVGPGSRVSEPAVRNVLTEAIEIIECAPAAIANLEAGTWTT